MVIVMKEGDQSSPQLWGGDFGFLGCSVMSLLAPGLLIWVLE